MSSSSSIPGEEISWYGIIDRIDSDAEVDNYMKLIAVDRDYIDTYGINILSGRFYQDGDNTWANGAIVINEAASKFFGFETEEAIGQPLVEKGSMFPELKVIGVVSDYHHRSLKEQVDPVAFVLSSWANHYSIQIRSSGKIILRKQKL